LGIIYANNLGKIVTCVDNFGEVEVQHLPKSVFDTSWRKVIIQDQWMDSLIITIYIAVSMTRLKFMPFARSSKVIPDLPTPLLV